MHRSVARAAWFVVPGLLLAACAVTPTAELGWEGLPAEVDAVIRLDMSGLAASEAYRQMAARTGDPTRSVLGLDFREMVEATGFDPQRDLKQITLAGRNGTAESEASFYTIVTGTFDRQRIVDYLRTKAAVRTIESEGAPVYAFRSTNGAGGEAAMAWVDDETLVVASLRGFPRMMESLRGAAPGLGETPLGRRLAGAAGQFVAIADLPDADAPPVAAPAGGALHDEVLGQLRGLQRGPLQGLRTVQLSLEATDGLQLTLRGILENDDRSKLLHDLLNGYVAMAKMAAADDPDYALLMDGVTLSYEGPEVRMGLAMSAAQIRGLLDRSEGVPIAIAPGS